MARHVPHDFSPTELVFSQEAGGNGHACPSGAEAQRWRQRQEVVECQSWLRRRRRAEVVVVGCCRGTRRFIAITVRMRVSHRYGRGLCYAGACRGPASRGPNTTGRVPRALCSRHRHEAVLSIGSASWPTPSYRHVLVSNYRHRGGNLGNEVWEVLC